MITLIALCLIALAIHLAGMLVAGMRALRTTPDASPSQQGTPPVSILRPVCGSENNLERTLESAFLLDWPSDYEIVFCAAREDDAAIPLVRRLIQAHPLINARLLVGDERISVNPKLNNLAKGWHAARYPWIVMADSNVLMPKDYLARLFARWQPGTTGMVCSPPVGSDPEGFWAEVECAWLNSYQARWQLIADEFGLGFAQGKTMMLHRGLLDAAGGIERLAGEVAEDAASTKIVRDAGLSVHLSERPFPQPIGRRQWQGIWRRQVRWARLRRDSFPLFFAPELLAGGLFPIATAIALSGFGVWHPLAAPAYALIWYGAEIGLIRAYRWPLSIATPLALVIRDAALPALWLTAWFGNGFDWRGNAMSVPSATGQGAARARLRLVMARTRDRAKAIAALRH